VHTRHFVILLFSIGVLLPTVLFGQEQDDIKTEFQLGLYLDIFYGYDFNTPVTNERLPYLYHHNRHNEFNLNHGVVAFRIENPKYRVNLSIQGGTYVLDNYSSEPELYKHIFDANIGIPLNKSSSIWLDAGIFGNSYIGFEGTFSNGNMNLGHNLISENVPYYMTGIKTSFTPNEVWSLALFILNGWQRIKKVEGNSMLSYGTEVTFSNENVTLNLSTFLGTDDPDPTRRIRLFNNLYAIMALSDRWNMVLGFDYGIQQKSKGSSEFDNWYGLAIIAQYIINNKWSLAARYEYYSDPSEVIVNSIDPQNGYITGGYSANIDYHILDNLLWRFEARYFNSDDPIYPKDGSGVSNNFFLLTAITLQLWKDL